MGPRSLIWASAGLVAALILGQVDFLITIGAQLLLKELGLFDPNLPLPGGLEHFSPTPVQLLLGFFTLLIVRAILQFLSNSSGSIAYVLLASKLRVGVVYDLLKRNEENQAAALVNHRISEISQKAASFCMRGANIVNEMALAAMLLAIMLMLTWQATIVGLAIIVLVGLSLTVINNRIRASAAGLPKENLELHRSIQRVARNWFLVRVLRTEDAEYEAMVNTILRYGDLDHRINRLSSLNIVLPTLFGSATIVLIVFVNIWVLRIDGPVFFSFIFLYLRLIASLANIARSYGTVLSSYPQFREALWQFESLTDEQHAFISHSVATLGAWKTSEPYVNPLRRCREMQQRHDIAPRIELRGLSFSYGANLPRILNGVNLVVPAGGQFGITGGSGSGKSTMLGLIMGVYGPSQGDVLIDGVPADEFFNTRLLRMGYVGAEPFLIEGTLRDNLKYGHPDPEALTDDVLMDALEKASLAAFVRESPGGLDTRLSEHGDGLSAGQKQRLSLARALAIDPRLLILDEVSANLDARTESSIADSIESLRGSATVLIVSHKPGMLKYADVSMNMEEIHA
jgi:ABC-type multidrug transport system fused ATPase/permease subunit